MLRKIAVNNIGVLKAFQTPNAPHLEKLTGFYARNGRGKSTLSCILRAVANGSVQLLQGRRTFGTDVTAPQVNLIFDGNQHVGFANQRWTRSSSPIAVFDTSFIAENLFAGETVDLTHDRKLFGVILGSEGVKLAKQQEFFNASAKRTAARRKETETALVNDIPTDQTRMEFFASLPSADIETRISEARMTLNAIRQFSRLQALQPLRNVTISALPDGIEAILVQTLQGIETSARSKLAEHFKKFKLGSQGEGWVKFGLEHIHDENCPFCGKSGVDDEGLVTIYNQIFGETYKSHMNTIQNKAEEIDTAFGENTVLSLGQITSANAQTLMNLGEFVNLDGRSLPTLQNALTTLTQIQSTLKDLFRTKRESPLSCVDGAAILIDAQSKIAEINTIFTNYNQAVDEIKTMVVARQAQSSQPEAQVSLNLANLVKRKNRTDSGVQARIEALLRAERADERAKRMRTFVQQKLKAANAQGAQHYYQRVNHYLEQFDATFRVSEFSNSMTGNIGSVDYGLIIRGHQIDRGRGEASADTASFKNSLSTGDKSTLAFAFFLAGIDRLPDIANQTIVIDDPLSSHDSHRKTKTIEIIRSLCDRCAQVIVLSHDQYFLREVKRTCRESSNAFYQIESDGPDNWSKASPANLDELCRSSHARQIAKLEGFCNLRQGDANDIALTVRTVLETYYRATYPAYFGSSDNLGPIIEKIRQGGSNHPCWSHFQKIQNCNDATNDNHHGDDPTIGNRPTIDPDNLRSTVLDCLELINVRHPRGTSIAA